MNVSVDGKRKFAVCVILVVISALLVGAGKVTGEMRDRAESGRHEVEECRELVSGFSADIPVEHNSSWKELSVSNPRLFLRVCSIERAKN